MYVFGDGKSGNQGRGCSPITLASDYEVLSSLCSVWLPFGFRLRHQRAFATSVVYGIQMAGPSVGFLLAFSVRNSQQLLLGSSLGYCGCEVHSPK